MIQMTIREALEIQARQIEYYSVKFPALAEMAALSTHIPDGADLDAMVPASSLVTMIPRGTSLGALIGVEF